jgi:hypothetical protein
MRFDGVRGYDNFQLYNRRCDDGRAGCGPRPGITVNGNTIETENYVISAKKGDYGEVLVRDKATGKTIWSGGDPYLRTGDGDFTSYQNGNVTVNLPDGSKLTLDPTDKNDGRNIIERAVYTKGNDAAVITFDGEGNPTTREMLGQGHRLDRRTEDGVDLFARNGSIDDLRVQGGPEIKGNSIGNLDVYRTDHGCTGGRPHIGLPNWRHDGPFSGWPRHASGPRWGDDCRSPGDRREGGWRIRDLLDQLRSARWQASHGPWQARVDARHEIRHLERRLRALTA